MWIYVFFMVSEEEENKKRKGGRKEVEKGKNEGNEGKEQERKERKERRKDGERKNTYTPEKKIYAHKNTHRVARPPIQPAIKTETVRQIPIRTLSGLFFNLIDVLTVNAI